MKGYGGPADLSSCSCLGSPVSLRGGRESDPLGPVYQFQYLVLLPTCYLRVLCSIPRRSESSPDTGSRRMKRADRTPTTCRGPSVRVKSFQCVRVFTSCFITTDEVKTVGGTTISTGRRVSKEVGRLVGRMGVGGGMVPRVSQRSFLTPTDGI